MAWFQHLIGSHAPSVHVAHMVGALVSYIVACRLVMQGLQGVSREVLLAAFNVAGIYGCLIYGRMPYANGILVAYLVLVCLQYVALNIFCEKKGWLPWLAFFTPIAFLVVARYTPHAVYVDLARMAGSVWKGGKPVLVGVSYLSFRASRLVLEVRNGLVKKPGFWEYFNFCFFLPTMPVGPINTYANYRRGFEEKFWDVPMCSAMLRILVGAVKYDFLGGLSSQLDYASLLLDDHPHPWMDLPVAMVFYYLFLYFNFSGFCDMAIGAAALIGIPVPENFDDPFAARNMREFWNRWHITLSQWMRDVVFAPLSKYLVRIAGPANVNHAVALAVGIVFFLIGVWHGVGWNYALFGLAQSLGVVTVHYYTLFLKKRLGRDGFKAYNDNRWIRAAAITLTFCYYAATLFLFANTMPQMKQILSVLRF